FLDTVIRPLLQKGWKSVEVLKDQPYDFLIEQDGRQVRIQVKLQRMEKGIPKLTSQRIYPGEEMFTVEVQKTRTGKDVTTQEDTRPYRFGEFDILAVNLQPSSGRWNKFLFTLGNWLLP